MPIVEAGGRAASRLSLAALTATLFACGGRATGGSDAPRDVGCEQSTCAAGGASGLSADASTTGESSGSGSGSGSPSGGSSSGSSSGGSSSGASSGAASSGSSGGSSSGWSPGTDSGSTGESSCGAGTVGPTCAPQPLGACTPEYHPPANSPGACTAADVAAFYNDCMDATEQICDGSDLSSAACFKCLASQPSDASWGAVVL